MPTTRLYFSGRGSVTVPQPILAAPWTRDSYQAYGGTAEKGILVASLAAITGGLGGSNDTNNNPPPEMIRNTTAIGPALTAPTTYTGTMRAVIRVQWNGATITPRMVLRVVSSAGVVKATLADAAANQVTVSGHYVRTFTAPITPYTAAVGDRLAVEIGPYKTSLTTYWASNYQPAAPSSGRYPLTFANAGPLPDPNDPGTGWLELIVPDPPAPLTGLTVTGTGVDTATLTWAPSVGATGYEVRVDGGPATAVGDVTGYTVPGLSPFTTYTLEVRATGPGGVSAWASVVATTLKGAAYRAVVRLGSHVWDVLAGDPPTYGPILPLSFGWLVPEDSHGFPAQPDPETLALELITQTAADMAGVDIGTVARVSLYTTEAPGARPLATFVGRVADLEATPTDDGGLRWRLLGVGYTTDGSTRPVGGTDWPTESGDARAARIAAEAGFPGWAADAVGCVVEARGPETTDARAELERTLDAAVTAEGSSNGPNRRVLWHPRVDAAGDLLPGSPFGGTAVVRRVDHIDTVTAGLINRRTTWRRTKLLDATHVTIDHPGGPTVYGDPRGPAYPPLSLPITDPGEFAELLLDTTPGYRWLTGDALRFELWAEQADTSAVLDWFYRDPASHPFPWSGRAVVVEGIAQAPDGSTRYAGMLAGARLILEPGGRLVVEFRLRPEIPADSTVTMRWMDEPAGATWAQELAADPTGTWFDYRTTPRP